MAAPQQHLEPEDALTRRAGLRDLTALATAAILAGLLLYFLFHGKLTRFEEIGLGKQTSAVFASYDGDPIHCEDMRNVAACLRGFERRGGTSAALWLGNSQLHGVNQWKPGDETAPANLFAQLRGHGVDLITLSQPNANLQEHLVLYAYVRTRLPLRYVLLPAVFDDAREGDIRSMITPALDDPATRAVLEQSDAGRSILASTVSVSDPDLAALDETMQERSEAFLNTWLDRNLELWDLRPEARGRISHWIYQVRNFVFGISPHSKRHLIEGRYLQNLAAAEAILDDAQQRGIHVFFYVAPIRGDVELPYVEAEYARYQQDVAELAKRYGGTFLNLADVVPAALFGTTESHTAGVASEPDFMHFQDGGHAILADRLAKAIAAASNGDVGAR